MAEMLRAVIPQHVYSRSAGERIVLMDMQTFRSTALNVCESKLWRRLEEAPGLERPLEALVSACVTEDNADAEQVMESIRGLAQMRLLEIRE
jgi:hypothetical protein